MNLSDAVKVYAGSSEASKVMMGSAEVWSSVALSKEWAAWDFDSGDPLLAFDYLVNEILTL